VAIKTDVSGNIRPVKPDELASGAKIDGIVASIMALGRAIVAEQYCCGDVTVIG
jgi:phage terminase large subunit-like protein